ncbi:MAG: DNA polymerase III subunit gamma/tau [Eubacteriales bacterium]|nr:DNA polymerase III subunit gamma/tau [Eubacteriales bacterium]
MYTALYRSFRPETFDGILGQEHIVKILKNQLKTGTTGHAYLFCGTRGTGKTSTARILAKGMNCLSEEGKRPCGICSNCVSIREGTFIDVIEIDAASNNGVDNIRELRESVKYPPAAGRCKVYIIDEVHMLSSGAFNALLKTLEEPPDNIMFILATTESQKIPATILSRCLRLDFKRVPENTMRQGMRDICSQMEVKISEAALGLIASNADGSVRDALSLLDQCISSGENNVIREHVIEILGTAGDEVFIEMTDLVAHNQIEDALLLLNRIIADGKDVRQFIKDWIAHFRSLMMTKFIKNPEDILNMSMENVERISRQSDETELSFIKDSIIRLSQTLSDAKWSTQPRILLELCIVKLATDQSGKEKAQLISTGLIQKGEAAADRLISVSNTKATGTSTHLESSHAESIDKNSLDYDRLWNAVFEEGEALKGSFNLLRDRTSLKKLNDISFTVEASDETILHYVKENASNLEKLMEKHIGKKLHMECCSIAAADDGHEKEKTAEELANEIGNKFGIHIDVD